MKSRTSILLGAVLLVIGSLAAGRGLWELADVENRSAMAWPYLIIGTIGVVAGIAFGVAGGRFRQQQREADELEAIRRGEID